MLLTKLTGEWFLSRVRPQVFTQLLFFTKILATKCTVKFVYNLSLPMFTAAMFVEQFRLSKPNSADFTMIYWDSVNTTTHSVGLNILNSRYLSRFSIVTERKNKSIFINSNYKIPTTLPSIQNVPHSKNFSTLCTVNFLQKIS